MVVSKCARCGSEIDEPLHFQVPGEALGPYCQDCFETAVDFIKDLAQEPPDLNVSRNLRLENKLLLKERNAFLNQLVALRKSMTVSRPEMYRQAASTASLLSCLAQTSTVPDAWGDPELNEFVRKRLICPILEIPG